MTFKPFFRFAALAAIACCIVLAAFLTVEAMRQLISLAGDFAGSISRVIF